MIKINGFNRNTIINIFLKKYTAQFRPLKQKQHRRFLFFKGGYLNLGPGTRDPGPGTRDRIGLAMAYGFVVIAVIDLIFCLWL